MREDTSFKGEYTVKLEDLQINTVINVSLSAAPAKTPTVVHDHPRYELVFSSDGDFTTVFADGAIQITPANTARLIPPGVYHTSYHTEGLQRRVYLAFSYKKTKCANPQHSLYHHFAGALGGIVGAPTFGAQTELPRLLPRLCDEATQQPFGYRLCLQALLQELYLALLRAVSDPAQEQPSAYANRSRYRYIEHWLNQNFKNNVTDKNLARDMHLSIRQMRRVFYTLYGKTFREKLIDKRLQYAAQQLAHTNQTVLQIALDSGYTSLSGFNTAFQKRFFLPPGAYREQHLNF